MEETEPFEICWLDVLGDEWLKEGVLPGNIFEFHSRLSPDCKEGGLVETTGAEGKIPKSPLEIKRVVVRLLNGEHVTLTGRTPLVVARFRRLAPELC